MTTSKGQPVNLNGGTIPLRTVVAIVGAVVLIATAVVANVTYIGDKAGAAITVHDRCADSHRDIRVEVTSLKTRVRVVEDSVLVILRRLEDKLDGHDKP